MPIPALRIAVKLVILCCTSADTSRDEGFFVVDFFFDDDDDDEGVPLGVSLEAPKRGLAGVDGADEDSVGEAAAVAGEGGDTSAVCD